MKKDNRRVWWTLFLLIASGIAILAGYYLGSDKWPDKKDAVIEEPEGRQPPEQAPMIAKEGLPEKEPPKMETIKESAPVEQKDDCTLVEEQVQEFFQYLDQKDYIKKQGTKTKAYDRFKASIQKLSADLPLPAGERRDPELMKNNLFFFFRTLPKKDLRMVTMVMKNEEDTLEMNLGVFYKWLMPTEPCPDPEDIRPSLKTMYHYAGFFTNTLGGRAYLFRRPTKLRLLFSYYCLLIIHEADKRDQNPYGINIAPKITPLIKDIGANPDLQFKDDYVNQLSAIQNYYKQSR